MSDNHKKVISYSDIVDEISSRNKDKVIHSELKETEFDDVVLGAVAPESERLRHAITTHSKLLTEYSEYELSNLAEPCQTDQLLRVSFWDEVNTALNEHRPISERNIWKGVCSCTYWYKVRDMMDYKMAYVLMPLMAYSKANKLGLHLGQKAMIEILNASAYEMDKHGKKRFNTRIAQLQLTAYQAIQDRVYGKAVQRIQSHNTNETVNNDDMSVEKLQQEIALLEGKVKPSEPVTIDVSND